MPTYNQLPYGEAAFNDLYSRYKGKADKRGLTFELDTTRFRIMTTSACVYCGEAPHKVHKVNKRVGEYTYNGIDRVDNTKGYIEGNVVSCCYNCNRMKHALGELEFLQHIERIYLWQHKQEMAHIN